MDSRRGDPCGPGCPIRRSPDQSLLAAPRGLSQPTTSFIASWCQGIHQMPLKRLIPCQPAKHPPRRSSELRRARPANQHVSPTPADPQCFHKIVNRHGHADVRTPPARPCKPGSDHVPTPAEQDLMCSQRSRGSANQYPPEPKSGQTQVHPAIAASSSSSPVKQPHHSRGANTLTSKSQKRNLFVSISVHAAACARCASKQWWVWVDSNYRPYAYQAYALTT